jgi:hypothetical protein
MKKIIILTEKHLLQRDYNYFGIKFLKKYFDVVIYDFYEFLHKPKMLFKNSNKIRGVKVVKITSLKQFDYNLNKNSFKAAFDYLRTSDLKKTFFFKINLQKKKILLIRYHNGLLPIFPKYYNFFYKLKNLFYHPELFFVYFKKIYIRFIKNKELSFIPDISLVSGLAAKDIYKDEIFIKKKFFTHSVDYSNFLIRKIKLRRKYIVFIDEMMPNHPDHKIIGLNDNLIDKENYYYELKKYLKRLSEVNKLDIKFLAHPKSNLKELKVFFHDFDVILNKTYEMVSSAKLVLAHQSTAISFAIILRKPLIFLTTNSINKTFYGERIKYLSKILSCKCINISNSNEFNFKNINVPNSIAYRNYLCKYIKHPKSDNILVWDLIGKYLANIRNTN